MTLAAHQPGRRSGGDEASRTGSQWAGLRPLRALSHDAASGNPAVYVQARAHHAQAPMTERYVHAALHAFPGAADKAELRLFGAVAD